MQHFYSQLIITNPPTQPSHNVQITTHTNECIQKQLFLAFANFFNFYRLLLSDRTILIWYLKDLSTTKDRKTFRINVEFDHVYKVTWSPDTKALVGFKAMGNAIEVYRVDRKEGVFFNYAKGITFSRYHENDDVVNMDIASNGKFIMTASNKTDLVLWDVRGNVLEHLNTFTMTNYSARISPCGRYVGVSGKVIFSFKI